MLRKQVVAINNVDRQNEIMSDELKLPVPKMGLVP